MLLIQRHMCGRLVGGAAAATAALGGAELLATTQPLIHFFANGALSLGQYALALLCALPVVLYLAGPVTSTAAIVYCYHEWGRHHQIVALRMAGLPDRSIAAPGVGAGVAAALFVAAMSLYLVPVSARVLTDIRYAALNRLSLEILHPGQMQPVTPEYSLWFRERSATGALQQVVVVDGRKPGHPIYIFAQRGYTVLPNDRQIDPAFLLESGTYMTQDDANQEIKFIAFQHLTIPLTDLWAVRNWRGFFEEHIGALLDPPPRVREDRAAYGEWLEEGHRRIIMPLLTLSYTIFALGALLQGEGQRRSFRVVAITLGVGLWHVLIVVSHSLVAHIPEAIPVYYAMALLPALIGSAMLHLPRRRPLPPSTASDRELVQVLE